ncbi:hypothetical protein A3J41_01435 [candidate division TM6 bacterium RIFCSPHIGHO2_12_FULL_38_8]|nr:MAG: hypothetical protein A3J41_01435 [candidate division TM6 bacterium RIFCSPHIGHO2_12_FULL_38_8]
MNKADLIEHMSKVSKQPRAVCKVLLESFISSVGSALKQNKEVALTGFGTFVVMRRKSRVGVNPATGKKMQIPAKNVPKFRPGKALKSLVG